MLDRRCGKLLERLQVPSPSGLARGNQLKDAAVHVQPLVIKARCSAVEVATGISNKRGSGLTSQSIMGAEVADNAFVGRGLCGGRGQGARGGR